jgi:hypothetical protein
MKKRQANTTSLAFVLKPHLKEELEKATGDKTQDLTGSLIVACYPEKTDALT